MRPHWLALVETEPRSAVLRAPVRDGGWVAVWDDERKTPKGAWRIDPRVLDDEGPGLEVGLAAGDPGVSLPFDDPAVTGPIRSALPSEPAVMCATLLDDSGRYAGALISPPHLATPFATIFPQRTLEVGPGLLGRTPWPTGPGAQRYVGDVPWPYDATRRTDAPSELVELRVGRVSGSGGLLSLRRPRRTTPSRRAESGGPAGPPPN